VPFVHDAMYLSRADWKSYVIPVLLVYVTGFVLYALVRLPLLLLSWHKQLASTQERVRELESTLEQQHLQHLEHLSCEGDFWVFYADQINGLWRDGVGRWSQHTAKQLHVYYGEAKAEAFNTFDGMDKKTVDGIDLRYLNWRLKNLRSIIQSLDAIPATRLPLE
jgi:hypothetical protein